MRAPSVPGAAPHPAWHPQRPARYRAGSAGPRGGAVVDAHATPPADGAPGWRSVQFWAAGGITMAAASGPGPEQTVKSMTVALRVVDAAGTCIFAWQPQGGSSRRYDHSLLRRPQQLLVSLVWAHVQLAHARWVPACLMSQMVHAAARDRRYRLGTGQRPASGRAGRSTAEPPPVPPPGPSDAAAAQRIASVDSRECAAAMSSI